MLAPPLLAATPATAQRSLDRPLRVYLDCNSFHCDTDYFTEEVPWVDFVRDRQDADVHVLGTRQSTGGGGSFYTLEFQGHGAFEGERITLTRITAGDATQDMRRAALADGVRQGLAPFADATPDPPLVEILPPAAPDQDVAASPDRDPWDRWTFNTRLSGSVAGESQQRFLGTSGSASADRVTEAWKVEIGFHGSVHQSRFEYDGTVESFSQESYSGRALVVRSVGRHWAVGALATWARSTFANFRHSAGFLPAVEYNVFPYSDSNRRLLTVLYTLGAVYNDYDEITLFQETRETVLEQRLAVSYDVTQPWGNVDITLRGNHYITKFGDGTDWPDPQFNLSLGGYMGLRLLRGLSLNFGGSVEMVRGQISLRAGGLTPAEILTRQRELATDYRYRTHFGLSYRFGSIFTGAVNERFEAHR